MKGKTKMSNKVKRMSSCKGMVDSILSRNSNPGKSSSLFETTAAVKENPDLSEIFRISLFKFLGKGKIQN